MALHKLITKKHRHIAIDTDEIIALDFNESLNDLRIYLRGGGSLTIEGKKAAKIWKQIAFDAPHLLQDEADEIYLEELS